MNAIAGAKQTDLGRLDTANRVANSKVVSSDIIHTDVLIIGAGLAGLSTALALPKSLSITILSKAALEVCSSHYAQGGIAASLDKTDSIEDHVTDTLIAGAGLCAVDNTTSILSAGQQAVQWLCEQGVPFTQTLNLLASRDDSLSEKAKKTIDKVLSTDDLHLTKEGGHGCRRVAHADDATGFHVMKVLTSQAQTASNVTILAFHEAISLLTSISAPDHPLQASAFNLNNRCQGAIVFDHQNNRQLTIYSNAVVMASGGLGQLFARASAPNVCVGDGVMMAWQAGCRLANLEFVQFHPTGLALGDSSFLISEALRGEGGRLYCPLTGKRFMLDIDERAELAPRDIVARAIAEQISSNGLGHVHLDVSHLPASFLIEHFPQIYRTLLKLGVDITTEAIPVAPTAHYSCGGIVTCDQGLTDLIGLYAAGEVAYTGLHGANRLASNSLLECIVVGRNIAKHLPHYLANYSANEFWRQPTATNSQVVALPKNKPTDFTFDNNKAKLTASVADIENITTQLKSLMTNNMGIVRDNEQLQQALLQLQQWLKRLNSVDDFSLENLDENNVNITSKSLSLIKITQQLKLATLIVNSAIQRRESRGGHYRLDFPTTTNLPLVSIILPSILKDTIAAHPTSDYNYGHYVVQNMVNSEPFQTLTPT